MSYRKFCSNCARWLTSEMFAGHSRCRTCRNGGHRSEDVMRMLNAPMPPREISEQGECRYIDPELFFPISDKSAPGLETIQQAKKVCGGCPVKLLCLEYSLDIREPHGIWGATTPDERQRLLKKRERAERRRQRQAA